MSDFNVPVVSLVVEKHKNADNLELAKPKGMDFVVVIKKGEYKTGDTAIYIPEQSVVPENIISEMGLVGRLAGSKSNRVKSIKLRGVLSQGLLYKNKGKEKIGKDMALELGIKKYVAPIPEGMKGEVCNIGIENGFNFDINNIKKYPDLIIEGEKVEITEKIHGTFMAVGGFPKDGYEHNEIMKNGKSFCSSKSLFKSGLAFKDNEINNKRNIYIRTSKKFKIDSIAITLANRFNCPFYILGEVFGKGVQDLGYGEAKNESKYRIFNMIKKEDGMFKFLNREEIKLICDEFEVKMVPILYEGSFSKEILKKYTKGKETISGEFSHIREGVVVQSLENNTFLKSINDDYLNRKNATEYN